MIFRKSTLLLCLAAAATTNAGGVRVLKSTKAVKATKSVKGAKSAVTPVDPCITEAEMEGTIDAFAVTVTNVTAAYYATETEPFGELGFGCQGAYNVAFPNIGAAYAYDLGPVLFKPTLASVPYTQRNTLAGALSYFIGTDCMTEVAENTQVFPDGNENGEIFNEIGFGMNIRDKGWTNAKMYNFEYLTGGPYCESALAIGQICWDKIVPREGLDPFSCVDKTFSFRKGTGGQFPAVITSHHSSQTVNSNSTLTLCQDHECGSSPSYDPRICTVPELGDCPIPTEP
jgi:hypothetical protein